MSGFDKLVVGWILLCAVWFPISKFADKFIIARLREEGDKVFDITPFTSLFGLFFSTILMLSASTVDSYRFTLNAPLIWLFLLAAWAAWSVDVIRRVRRLGDVWSWLESKLEKKEAPAGVVFVQRTELEMGNRDTDIPPLDVYSTAAMRGMTARALRGELQREPTVDEVCRAMADAENRAQEQIDEPPS